MTKAFPTQIRLKRLARKAKRMSNEDLRKALWTTRKKSEEKHGINDEESRKLLRIEGIYADELKRRELLEWALRTGGKNSK